MSSIIFLFILVWIIRRVNPDKRKSDMGKVLGIFFAFLFFAGILSSLPFLFPLAVIIAVFVAVFKKAAGDNASEKEYQKTKKRWEEAYRTKGRETGTSERSSSYTGASNKASAEPNQQKTKTVRSSVLPRPVTKRTRIIRNFNEKYALTLTESEMQRIVDASYMSNAWKRELEAMTEKYETVYEYFQGPTSWLRVYMHAFQIQSITSDFAVQERIAFDAFDEIFAYLQDYRDLTIQEMILRTNERFFANFDDVTFMIAYRFLQEKGRHYELGRVRVVQNEDSQMEDLMKKYQEQE